MKGKCNCGKKATTEYLVRGNKVAWTIKLCDVFQPQYPLKELTLIHGKTYNEKNQTT